MPDPRPHPLLRPIAQLLNRCPERLVCCLPVPVIELCTEVMAADTERLRTNPFATRAPFPWVPRLVALPGPVWAAGWLLNRSPVWISRIAPRAVVEAAYRQRRRHWLER